MAVVSASRSSDRRSRLLDAAVALFSRWGYDKTSVDDIAAETGISKGAVYLEFPDKDALFKAAVQREFLRYSEDWLRRFEADPGEWSFARMFQHSLAAMNAAPLVRALVTRDRRIYGRFLQREPEFIARSLAHRGEFFRELQRAGALRDDLPAPVMANLVTMVGYGLIAGDDIIPEENRVPFETSLHALAQLLDRGLSPLGRRDSTKARLVVRRLVAKMRATLEQGAADPGVQSGPR